MHIPDEPPIGNLVAFLILAVILFRRPGRVGRPALDENFSSASADNAPTTARRRVALSAVGVLVLIGLGTRTANRIALRLPPPEIGRPRAELPAP